MKNNRNWMNFLSFKNRERNEEVSMRGHPDICKLENWEIAYLWLLKFCYYISHYGSNIIVTFEGYVPFFKILHGHWTLFLMSVEICYYISHYCRFMKKNC